MTHIRNEYLVADSINEFDMMICNRLHQRVRSLSDLSDLSDDNAVSMMKTSETKKEEEENCCICFEPMNLKKNYCVTPCGHPFCFGCIVKTMAKQNACPCCRAPLYQEESFHTNVIEENEMDVQSVMNASLSSNIMILYNNENDMEISSVFPHYHIHEPDVLLPMNLQNAFDNADSDASTTDDMQPNEVDTLLSEDDVMEITTDVSVSLPTYISQDSREHVLEQWPPLSESERNLWSAGIRSLLPAHSGLRPPNTTNSEGDFVTGRVWSDYVVEASSRNALTEPVAVVVSDILPPSMDNIPRFGNNTVLTLHARMRQEGYNMLDVLMITLMLMYPQEIREDIQSYQCAQGLNSIIHDLHNENKEKMLFAMEDRNVL